MSYSQIILITFFSLAWIIIISGLVVKYHRGKAHIRGAGSRIRAIHFKLKEDIFELGKLALMLEIWKGTRFPSRLFSS